MLRKEATTKDNYKEVVLKRAIIVCWVLLAICFVVKLCGGNFFYIVCNNGEFIAFCDYVDNSIIRHIIHFIMFMLSSYMLIIIVNPKLKFKCKKNLISFIYLVCVWVFKKLIELNIIALSMSLINILDAVLLFIVLYYNCKSLWKSLLSVGLLFVFTIISVVIKNTGIKYIVTESFLINTIFMIDYYIMLVITALYSKKIDRR